MLYDQRYKHTQWVRAFKFYVLAILDYCSQVWSPYHIIDINRLESVQSIRVCILSEIVQIMFTERSGFFIFINKMNSFYTVDCL